MQAVIKEVSKCLQRAVQKNNGKPVSFFKFAINPYSLSQTIENCFHLASLVKDRHVIIEKNSGFFIYLLDYNMFILALQSFKCTFYLLKYYLFFIYLSFLYR